MHKAIRVVASSFGAFAGFGGIEHGIFEIMQGNVAPGGVTISSIGPPCVPELAWNACEPAITLLPNFLATGILAVVLGVATMVWSLFFIHRRRSGLVLFLLSLALLLFGGGIFPPVIGMIGAAVATRIDAPILWWRQRLSGSAGRFLAGFWPWIVIVLFVALFGQFIVGHFFNDFLLRNGWLILVLIPLVLVLTVLSAFAWDVQRLTADNRV